MSYSFIQAWFSWNFSFWTFSTTFTRFFQFFYHFLQKRFCRFDFSLFYVWSPWDVPNFEEISSKTSNPLINFLRTVFFIFFTLQRSFFVCTSFYWHIFFWSMFFLNVFLHSQINPKRFRVQKWVFLTACNVVERS